MLELGCGTGRLLAPMARAGVATVGVDRSAAMLNRARARVGRLPRARRPPIVRGDIRRLPFAAKTFDLVMAPYGMLQSLTAEADLVSTLGEAARLLRRRGVLGIDLVPDLPAWEEYRNRVSLRGAAPGGARITLVESVRQDRRRHLTTFDQHFIETRGRARTSHRFSLTFRTLSVPQMVDRIKHAGFVVEALLGDYRGGPWDPLADAWLILARRP